METIIFYEIVFKLVLAVILGGFLGAERTIVGKSAGMRTFSLVCMGSALFVIISQVVSSQYVGVINFDPLRMASQIVVGIGFLGAGLIIFQESKLQGLTTAAGLWVSAGLGMSIGFGLYFIALAVSLLTLAIFTLMWLLEDKIKKTYDRQAGLDEKN